jgi:hypothetical protein
VFGVLSFQLMLTVRLAKAELMKLKLGVLRFYL